MNSQEQIEIQDFATFWLTLQSTALCFIVDFCEHYQSMKIIKISYTADSKVKVREKNLQISQ